MWCSDCNTDFATVPGSVIQICPACSAKEKSGARRRRRVPKLEQTNISQRRQFESTGQISDQQPARNLESTATNSTAKPASSGFSWGRRSATHLVCFGLFVFLVGQALQIWAFLQNVLFVWSMANLVSIVGITVAFSGAFISLQGFDCRLRELARLVGRAEISSRPKRRTLRQRLSGKRG